MAKRKSRAAKKPDRPASDKRPYPATIVNETGRGILLLVQLPGGESAEIWQPRAAVTPLPGGQWLISQAAIDERDAAATDKPPEQSRADAAFGKDFLPVLGEIASETEKAQRVRLFISWHSPDGSESPPEPKYVFVPKSQAALRGKQLCLSRWIIGEKEKELTARGMGGPEGGGGRIVADEYKPKAKIQIDEEALAAAILAG